MSVLQIGIFYGIATFVLLFSGMPIAFAVGTVALTFMYFFMPAINLWQVAEIIYGELDNFTLLTIPLFVLMGAAIGKSRAGTDLYSSLNRWLYRIPGGLGVANVWLVRCSPRCAVLRLRPVRPSARAVFRRCALRGYSEELATGLIAAGGTLGILIPPSLTLILYGLASEQSIGKLFMAGFGPGLLLTVLFIVWVVYKYRRERSALIAGRAPGHDAR